MDLFAVLKLIGGLALFLYGMTVMGNGLEKVSGGRLEHTLEKLTNHTVKGVLLGAGVTAIIQSSSATTVMVVGFVNSGIMKLSQAIGIIMGANIGTTVTAWILSLTGIESNNVFVSLLKPDSFSPILAMIGIVLIMAFKNGRKRDIGTILLGFSVLMYGMSSMSEAVKPLANVPEFANFLLLFKNPLFGVLAGTLLTAVIQSSSASVGILQALSVTGSISFSCAMPIILGQNIGTCATALISCIGANKNAKRAAMVHLYFNIIGAILFMTCFYSLNALFHFSFITKAVGPADIAVVHTTFNVLSTLVLMPFSSLLGKLATLTIRDKNTADEAPLLDERFLSTPSFAVDQCRNLAVKMAKLSRGNLLDSIACAKKYSQKLAAQISDNELLIDEYEDKLGTYLVKLSSRELTERDSRTISELLHIIGDLERISDHAVNITETAQEMYEKGLAFSADANADLSVITDALTEILTLTTEAFEEGSLEKAYCVEPLEQVIDELKLNLKNRHIDRLQKGQCTIELGFILSDLLTNYERVSDHCSNIAVCIIQIDNADFNTHSSLNEIKNSHEARFSMQFDAYREKYQLQA